MNRKNIVRLCGMFLGVSLLAGCAKTPEDSVIKLKGEAAQAGYEEAETSGQTLRELVEAPEHYESETKDVTGKLRVITDAKVEIPEAKGAGVIAVSQHPFGQEEIDRITEALFGDAQIYDYYSYTERTKADCMARIEELEAYVAAGNLDPYNEGMEADGNYVFDIYGAIEQAKREYENAPEEASPEKVHPQYGLEVGTGMGEKEVQEDSFSGIAQMSDGRLYQYEIFSYGPVPMGVQMKRLADTEHVSLEQPEWSTYESAKNTGLPYPEEEDLKEDIGISLEEACGMADEKASALGFSDMDLVSWDYAIQSKAGDLGPEGFMLGSQNRGGYLLHYARCLDGVPVTYTIEEGGAYEDIEGVTETWSYERLDFYVTKEGIDRLELRNQYDIGEVRTEHAKLLPFSDIMEIYEKMMQIQNGDVLNYEDSRTYRIDRITLGYSRIYEPSTDNRQGVLVPVWDFFGSFEAPGRETYKEPNQSFLTINAADGSVINRSLGY
ncbi:MAG: hypothetical protein HFI67_03040 [Lachnospiraceae bacterium]|nr:hypothetical protein [Lachnospiraceae bacterium]